MFFVSSFLAAGSMLLWVDSNDAIDCLAVQANNKYTVSQKKLCHFYFYCNFGKCLSIFKILSMSESERNGS